MRKYAIDMRLPDGKRPGYYAQLVKALASVPLYDRDKETLIAADETGADAVKALLEEYRIEYDELLLLELPQQAEVTPAFPDYGFESRGGRRYLFAHLTALFRLVGKTADPASRQAALLQMDEHLIARIEAEDVSGTLYAVDASLLDLMRGIARAYECAIEPVDAEG
ncbi:hypothetical protein [Paenibacillus sp. HJGM_3]|uniref:hypothetical protein n=1 Tax=Paenibacillus sp. HJGM_3 TaxID=3379816 RepID=UPI00385B5614